MTICKAILTFSFCSMDIGKKREGREEEGKEREEEGRGREEEGRGREEEEGEREEERKREVEGRKQEEGRGREEEGHEDRLIRPYLQSPRLPVLTLLLPH